MILKTKYSKKNSRSKCCICVPSFSLVRLPSSGEGGNVFPQTRTWNSLSRKKSFSKKENIRKEIKREEMLASFFYELFFCAQDIKWSLERYWWAMGYPYSAVCSYSKGSPFLKCVGSIWALPKQLQTPHPLCQTGKRRKKCLLSSWQALKPPDNMGKSAPNHPVKPLQPPPPPLRAMPIETIHFKKGLPLLNYFSP